MIDCTHVIEFCKKESEKLLTSYQVLVSNRCVRAFGRSSGRTELYYNYLLFTMPLFYVSAKKLVIWHHKAWLAGNWGQDCQI